MGICTSSLGGSQVPEAICENLIIDSFAQIHLGILLSHREEIDDSADSASCESLDSAVPSSTRISSELDSPPPLRPHEGDSLQRVRGRSCRGEREAECSRADSELRLEELRFNKVCVLFLLPHCSSSRLSSCPRSSCNAAPTAGSTVKLMFSSPATRMQ